MDEYTFAYVNQEHSQSLKPFRAPSPKPSPLPTALAAPKSAPRPPQASVRRRADSHPRKNSVTVSHSRDATDYHALDQPPWYMDLSDSDDDEDREAQLADAELHALRSVNLAHLASCRKLLDHVANVLETLDSIKTGFNAVSEQTSTLQTSCSDLQAEEDRLQRLADNVKSTLLPFSYLATANRLLNVPGSSLVLQPSYQDLLINVQQSLDFLAKHQDYKGAEFYTRQYRQAMTKALTLARVHFSNSMREVSADITNRTQVNAMNKNTQSALLYTKFRSILGQVRPLMKDIEDASRNHEEYWSLLNDCWLSYFSMRKSLLNPMITNAFKDMANITDFATFTTSAISFMRILALDERELFASFFSTGREEFTTFLAALGQFFTDALRPRIAAESSLNTLCEVCSGMQAQCAKYTDDQETVVFDLSPVLATTLNEIQSRIVLRAQGVVINEIQGYKPTEKDLNYPGSLRKTGRSRMASNGSTVSSPIEREPAAASISERMQGSPSISRRASLVNMNDTESLSSAIVHERWYVTLRVSISLLSKIYKLVQSSIFDELAHEVVRSCIASLLHASNLIKRRNSIDGHLFLLKHLLILKDQIASFDIEHSDPEQSSGIDLRTVTGAFWDLTNRSASELFAPTALYNLASSTLSKLSASGYLSRKVENMSDAREELEDQTRLVIGTLTLYCADSVTGPLRSAMGNKSQSSKDLTEANRKFRASCPDSFSLWIDSLELYLDDERSINVLIGIIQDKVLETYERFDTYTRDLKKQKAQAEEPFDVEIPTVMETVDWINNITRLQDDVSLASP